MGRRDEESEVLCWHLSAHGTLALEAKGGFRASLAVYMLARELSRSHHDEHADSALGINLEVTVSECCCQIFFLILLR